MLRAASTASKSQKGGYENITPNSSSGDIPERDRGTNSNSDSEEQYEAPNPHSRGSN